MMLTAVPTKIPTTDSGMASAPGMNANVVTRLSGVDAGLTMRRATCCMLVLDRNLRILSADEQAEKLLLEMDADGCIPAELNRELTRWVSAGMPATAATFATTQGLLARALVLAGESPAIGLLLERTRSRESLEEASRRYRLSGREREVSRHIIDGNSSGEISLELGISEYTVADYLKRIFVKTGARSRSELVAMLLGWRSGAQPTTLRRIAQ